MRDQASREVCQIQTVVKSAWDQVWEPMYREMLVRNSKMGEEVRTKLVTLSINMLDLRLVVASSQVRFFESDYHVFKLTY